MEHLDEVKPEGVENEAVEQVAFADKILLNKTDLVDAETLKNVTARIRAINAYAEVIPTTHSRAPLDKVLGICAFDLSRVLAFDPEFLAIDAEHQHDTTVSSVGIVLDAELDGTAMQKWLSALLRDKGADIFRSKGVFAIRGGAQKIVFQGVHMLVTCVPLAPWAEGEKRSCKAVFIGRNLDRKALEDGLKACIAK